MSTKPKMKLKKGDHVQVIQGKDIGKRGEIARVYPERNKGPEEKWVLGSGKRGQDFYDRPDGELLHLTNWVECVRSRKKPNCPAEAGVSAAAAAHLGNQALRSGQVAAWKS